MTKIKDIKDLGENEVIHCPTVEEAIEINKVLNLGWTELEIKSNFNHLGDQLCLRPSVKWSWSRIEFYKERGYNIHPASSFLPESFYQVEPKVGDKWTCTNNVMPPYFGIDDYFNHKVTVGKTYEIVSISGSGKTVDVIDDLGKSVGFDTRKDDSMYLPNFFKFHSNPETMIDVNQPSGPMSEAHSSVIIDPMKHELIAIEKDEHEAARKQLWISAWAGVASAFNCKEPESATKWADAALKAFDERFVKN